MKTRKLLWLLPLCFLLLASVLTNGCDNDDTDEPIYYDEYTTLHDKPLYIIKRSIRGEWKI
jgi:hypothetical protein